MKAIKGGLDNLGNDFRRNLNAVNPHLGNPHLNKVLAAEKVVCNCLNTWPSEHNEASKYLAAWGKSEGTDLSEITEKLSSLTIKMVEAEGVFGNNGGLLLLEVGINTYEKLYVQYRTHLKDIRTRESMMKDQRSKKETIWTKIEKEERRASTSKAQGKINEYHKEIERLEKESLAEETALADYKREKLRTALLVQIDALYEFGSKMALISGFSRKIIEQIPMGKTEPGEVRSFDGQEKISQIVAHASIALAAWAPPIEHRPSLPPRPPPSPALSPIVNSNALVSQNITAQGLMNSEKASDPFVAKSGKDLNKSDHDSKNSLIKKPSPSDGDSSNEVDYNDFEANYRTNIEAERILQQIGTTISELPPDPSHTSALVKGHKGFFAIPQYIPPAMLMTLTPQKADIEIISDSTSKPLDSPVVIKETSPGLATSQEVIKIIPQDVKVESTQALPSATIISENYTNKPTDEMSEAQNVAIPVAPTHDIIDEIPTDLPTKLSVDKKELVKSDTLLNETIVPTISSDKPKESPKKFSEDTLLLPDSQVKKDIKHVHFSDVEDEIP
ncbi:hypothetical protein G9A89_018564 [Geosiphon pyriformis]|nr:hypothetical protein G9A89_018564 [Geosiphon pyriformis]